MDIENGIWWLVTCLVVTLVLAGYDSRVRGVRVVARVVSTLAIGFTGGVVLVWFVWILVLGGNLR